MKVCFAFILFCAQFLREIYLSETTLPRRPAEMETRDDVVVVREVIGTTEERAVPREHRRSGWRMRGLHLALG